MEGGTKAETYEESSLLIPLPDPSPSLQSVSSSHGRPEHDSMGSNPQGLPLTQIIQVRSLHATSEPPNPCVSSLPLPQHLPLAHATLHSTSCSRSLPPQSLPSHSTRNARLCLIFLENPDIPFWDAGLPLRPLCPSGPHEPVPSPLYQGRQLPPHPTRASGEQGSSCHRSIQVGTHGCRMTE